MQRNEAESKMYREKKTEKSRKCFLYVALWRHRPHQLKQKANEQKNGKNTISSNILDYCAELCRANVKPHILINKSFVLLLLFFVFFFLYFALFYVFSVFFIISIFVFVYIGASIRKPVRFSVCSVYVCVAR